MQETKKVVLAYFYSVEDKDTLDQTIDECIALCHACGMQVLVTVTQQTQKKDQGFGKGKLESLKNTVSTVDAEAVVFANNLSIGAIQKIHAITKVEVIDRTALILSIFSLRARTKEAMLQIEMARLQYDLPRLSQIKAEENHARGGGVTNRGAGEMRSAILKRQYQSRIQQLKKQLEILAKDQSGAEQRRSKTNLAKVALVGYTNAGKSSLMNAILKKYGQEKKDVYVEDMLFATLDTSVRKVEYENKQFFLYDTVGFVSNLPHELVEAFKSTLSAASQADLLIHVIDVTDHDIEHKIDITEHTLKLIGAASIPILRVYNKIDLMDELPNYEGLYLSTKTGKGLEELLASINSKIYPEDYRIECLLPYDKMKLFDDYKKRLSIEIIEEREEGILLEVKGQEKDMKPFLAYLR